MSQWRLCAERRSKESIKPSYDDKAALHLSEFSVIHSTEDSPKPANRTSAVGKPWEVKTERKYGEGEKPHNSSRGATEKRSLRLSIIADSGRYIGRSRRGEIKGEENRRQLFDDCLRNKSVLCPESKS